MDEPTTIKPLKVKPDLSDPEIREFWKAVFLSSWEMPNSGYGTSVSVADDAVRDLVARVQPPSNGFREIVERPSTTRPQGSPGWDARAPEDDDFEQAAARFAADLATYRGALGRDAVRSLALPGWEHFGLQLDWLDTMFGKPEQMADLRAMARELATASVLADLESLPTLIAEMFRLQGKRLLAAHRMASPEQTSSPEQAPEINAEPTPIEPLLVTFNVDPDRSKPGPIDPAKHPDHQRVSLATAPANGMVKIGRLRTSHILFANEFVARMHAMIELSSEGWHLIDLGTERTTVNGIEVTRNALVKVGDVLGFGPCTLTLDP